MILIFLFCWIAYFWLGRIEKKINQDSQNSYTDNSVTHHHHYNDNRVVNLVEGSETSANGDKLP